MDFDIEIVAHCFCSTVPAKDGGVLSHESQLKVTAVILANLG